jgi:hypothetical protein
MSKLIHLVAALALISAIGGATVGTADAACGFSNSRYVCR